MRAVQLRSKKKMADLETFGRLREDMSNSGRLSTGAICVRGAQDRFAEGNFYLLGSKR